ncbi:hypothetical protein EP073_03880 [Geovibrio thiophilus]|uniref:Alginate export domain-containing protein n=1 Tax=Geovibrio thiophilus TaxID=139438 RepID=A0A410JWN3_9BACT|nr:hypothetical protein [Geovibrio thiophilus]QAR32574.1 hypothetical protein EP073_03880 [Geovibrio thiophilus]
MKLLRGFLIFVLLAGSVQNAYSFSIDGSFSTSYESSEEKGGDTEGTWENTLILDNVKLINPYLGFNFHGTYSEEDGESFTDIYSAYVEFSSFERALEIKLGRFSFMGNRFLTLDGAEATVRTDWHFGVTAFGGVPEYFDSDDRHINESFRDTGDRLYGGRLFLNGVKNYTGYVSYSKEEDGDRTIQELMGLGLGRRFVSLRDKTVFLSLDGKIDYDMEDDEVYRGMARVYARYKKLGLIADATRIRVEDGSERLGELIITNFSSGKEDRYSYTVEYAINDHYTVYQGTTHVVLLNNFGEWVTGDIYKFGASVDHFKSHGLTSDIEMYIYDGSDSEANGVSFSLDWSILRELRFSFEAEYIGRSEIKNGTIGMDKEESIYSIYGELEYDVIKDLAVSVYAENNRETRYLPENRYGVKATYSF